MCCKGFFKRIVPFFLTFAVGLFIASFFVSIAAPNFQFRRDFRRHRQRDRIMQYENQRLNEENLRLRKQLAEQNTPELNNYSFDKDLVVPPPPLMPVRAKSAPIAPILK